MRFTQARFAERTEGHRRELQVHCYRMLGSFEEAEDLVQETMLRAWRRRADLDRDEHLRVWLYSIATNACLDSIKAKGRRVPSLGSFRDIPWLEPYPDALLEPQAPASAEPAASVIGRETIELTFLAVIRAPGDSAYRAFKIDVLRVTDGAIAEVTTFGAKHFGAFGLPAVLP